MMSLTMNKDRESASRSLFFISNNGHAIHTGIQLQIELFVGFFLANCDFTVNTNIRKQVKIFIFQYNYKVNIYNYLHTYKHTLKQPIMGY